jgi:hypothetical protein
VRRTGLVSLILALGLAGCGGSPRRTTPPPPRLPRALAHAWAAQADAVAQALAAGDGCTAERLASSLRDSVVEAIDARRIAPALREPLGSAVDDLPDRISCNPAPPTPQPKPKPKPKHGHGPEKHKGHG